MHHVANTEMTSANWPTHIDAATWVAQLADALMARQWQLCTAESCTGGLIAAACTDLAGSSRWFERGFVTYSNNAKAQQLGVSADLIALHGAVSEPVAVAMAQGAAMAAQTAVSIAVTGIAGPDGGSPGKPVGKVHFGCCVAGQSYHSHQCFAGDRHAVRDQSLRYALWWTLQCILKA